MSKMKEIYIREDLIANVSDEITQFVYRKKIKRIQLKPYEEGFNEGLSDSLSIINKILNK